MGYMGYIVAHLSECECQHHRGYKVGQGIVQECVARAPASPLNDGPQYRPVDTGN